MRGIAPPSATKVFKNERRELFGGVIVKTAFLVGGRLEQVLADGPKPIHLGCAGVTSDVQAYGNILPRIIAADCAIAVWRNNALIGGSTNCGDPSNFLLNPGSVQG